MLLVFLVVVNIGFAALQYAMFAADGQAYHLFIAGFNLFAAGFAGAAYILERRND